MKITAIAQRSGSWWAVSVPEVDGLITQAKRLDQVPAMVADAYEALEGSPPSRSKSKCRWWPSGQHPLGTLAGAAG